MSARKGQERYVGSGRRVRRTARIVGMARRRLGSSVAARLGMSGRGGGGGGGSGRVWHVGTGRRGVGRIVRGQARTGGGVSGTAWPWNGTSERAWRGGDGRWRGQSRRLGRVRNGVSARVGTSRVGLSRVGRHGKDRLVGAGRPGQACRRGRGRWGAFGCGLSDGLGLVSRWWLGWGGLVGLGRLGVAGCALGEDWRVGEAGDGMARARLVARDGAVRLGSARVVGLARFGVVRRRGVGRSGENRPGSVGSVGAVRIDAGVECRLGGTREGAACRTARRGLSADLGNGKARSGVSARCGPDRGEQVWCVGSVRAGLE